MKNSFAAILVISTLVTMASAALAQGDLSQMLTGQTLRMISEWGCFGLLIILIIASFPLLSKNLRRAENFLTLLILSIMVGVTAAIAVITVGWTLFLIFDILLAGSLAMLYVLGIWVSPEANKE